MKKILFVISFAILLFGACKKTDQHLGLSSTVSISPAQGYSGSLVTITGSGFSLDPAMDSVTFNGKRAEVVNVSTTQLIVVVPDSAGNGPVMVTVGGRTAKGPTFSFTQNTMVISSLSPASGFPGNVILIHGHGFIATDTAKLSGVAGITPQVTINGKAAVLLAQSDTLLTVRVPQGTGSGPVSVTLAGNTVTGPVFTYTNVVSASPSTGGPGTPLVITGTGFVADTGKNVVTFGNNIRGTVVSATATQLTVIVPPGVANALSTGTLPISINGYPITNLTFTVVPPPTVSSMIPTSGPTGTNVTFSGSGFTAGSGQTLTITFNGISASPGSNTGTQMVVPVPATATSGPVVIAMNGQLATGPKLSYTVQSLGLLSITPGVGNPDTVVTISGTGFSTNPALDTVKINGLAIPVQTATATKLTLTLPQAITSGPVTVSTGGMMAGGLSFYVGCHVVTYVQVPSPSGLAFDKSGDIFVSEFVGPYSSPPDPYAVQEITPGPTVTNSTLSAGVQAQLSYPSDLLFDQHGNLYVANAGNNGFLNKISPGGVLSVFQSPASYCGSLAVDASGNIYLVDDSRPNVYEYDSSGNLLQTITISGASTLYGVAIDGQNNLYVTDIGLGIIYENGNPVVSSGLSQPTDIVIDAHGKLIVADYGNSAVYQIDPASGFKQTVIAGGGSSGNQNGVVDGDGATALFAHPYGLRLDAQGNIWVADNGNNAIREIILH